MGVKKMAVGLNGGDPRADLERFWGFMCTSGGFERVRLTWLLEGYSMEESNELAEYIWEQYASEDDKRLRERE